MTEAGTCKKQEGLNDLAAEILAVSSAIRNRASGLSAIIIGPEPPSAKTPYPAPVSGSDVFSKLSEARALLMDASRELALLEDRM